MATCIPNTIKFHDMEHGKGLWFEHSMHFIPAIITSMGSITDQEEEKCFLYNLIM